MPKYSTAFGMDVHLRSAADSASKNDRNDAARMAKAILAHDISPAWVPSVSANLKLTTFANASRRMR